MPEEINHIDSTDNPLDEKKFQLLKNGLYNRVGISYIDFKKTLKPNYTRVWADIILGWAGIFIMLTGSWLLLKHGNLIFKFIIFFTSTVLIGYMIAYLVNFFHEAAHYNISDNKETNDRLANLLIGILIGQGIKNYRIVHWQHHAALGTTNDTERSYFESLDLRFLFFSLTGISALSFFLKRNEFVSTNKKDPGTILKKEKYSQLFISLVFHIALLSLMLLFKKYWLVIIWVMAVGCFYPFFNRLRQLIEHRSDNADKKINYAKTDHGKLTRIFGNSLFDKSFGSAGFNKHMLHHLEPAISYTRLNELEKFLRETSLGEVVIKQRSSYIDIFKRLLNK